MSFVIVSGSRQYVVDYGQKIIVNKISGNEGDVVNLPVVFDFSGSKSPAKTLQAKIIKNQKGKKLRVVKYKSKSNYHKQYGPRQHETILEIVK
jgi:large subunit ribosomal protein L21